MSVTEDWQLPPWTVPLLGQSPYIVGLGLELGLRNVREGKYPGWNCFTLVRDGGLYDETDRMATDFDCP